MFELLSQVSGPADIPFLDYIDLGVLAVLVVAVVKGWFVTGREKDSLVADKESAIADRKKAEEKFDLYQEKVQNEILPQLFETTRVLGEVMELISRLSRELSTSESKIVERIRAASEDIDSRSF